MALYLVRHAKAGSRQNWWGPDSERPLTEAGHAQARRLAERFSDVQLARVISSPYVRCRQTVEPLAEARALSIESSRVLVEGARFEAVLRLLDTLPEGSVLCSHGDVIPDTIDALARRGMLVIGEPEWRKGSLWVLERDDGTIVQAHAEAPPA